MDSTSLRPFQYFIGDGRNIMYKEDFGPDQVVVVKALKFCKGRCILYALLLRRRFA